MSRAADVISDAIGGKQYSPATSGCASGSISRLSRPYMITKRAQNPRAGDVRRAATDMRRTGRPRCAPRPPLALRHHARAQLRLARGGAILRGYTRPNRARACLAPLRSVRARWHARAGGGAILRALARGARLLWPGQNPLGQTLDRGNRVFEIIGVVGDVRGSDTQGPAYTCRARHREDRIVERVR